MSRRALVVMAASFFVAAGSPALAQDRTLTPRGEYARIDTRATNEAIAALSRGDEAAQDRVIAQVKAQPEGFAPPVFYVLSRVLFQRGQKDEAAFWFYAGQLRARFDANRCADVSARQAVSALNQQFGGPINQYAFQDIAKLEALVPRVVAWDRQTPHRYDHRWINLHGMNAVLSATDPKAPAQAALSLPEAEWPQIAEKTRQDYLAGFRDAMVEMKNRRK